MGAVDEGAIDLAPVDVLGTERLLRFDDELEARVTDEAGQVDAALVDVEAVEHRVGIERLEEILRRLAAEEAALDDHGRSDHPDEPVEEEGLVALDGPDAVFWEPL